MEKEIDIFTHTIELIPEVAALTYRQFLSDILNSDCTSYALKSVVKEWIQRDPLDALKDAEVLTALLVKRNQPLLKTVSSNTKCIPKF